MHGCRGHPWVGRVRANQPIVKAGMSRKDPRSRAASSGAPRRGRSPAERALAERLLAAARAGKDVRADKVRRLRSAIDEGAYENNLKLQVALERMLSRMGERREA